MEESASLPDYAFHLDIDKIVLNASKSHLDSIKTAMLYPPTIYAKIEDRATGAVDRLTS